MAERLQKILARAGVASRRACEELILEGRVRVNGKRMQDLPVLADPDEDRIEVDGRPIRFERKVYFLLNKPKGVLCTQSDPSGRKLASDLLPDVKERVYPVGRLDADSKGLLLMTNDGDLAAKLTHPRYGVPKTYRARVAGRMTPEKLAKLREGIWLSEGKTQPARVRLVYEGGDNSVVEITLGEGRNRQVRRMLSRLGHRVRELTRIRIGPLSLRGLGVGQSRPLKPAELRELKEAAERPKPASRRTGKKARASAGKASTTETKKGKKKPTKPTRPGKRSASKRRRRT